MDLLVDQVAKHADRKCKQAWHETKRSIRAWATEASENGGGKAHRYAAKEEQHRRMADDVAQVEEAQQGDTSLLSTYLPDE